VPVAEASVQLDFEAELTGVIPSAVCICEYITWNIRIVAPSSNTTIEGQNTNEVILHRTRHYNRK